MNGTRSFFFGDNYSRTRRTISTSLILPSDKVLLRPYVTSIRQGAVHVCPARMTA